MNRKSVRLIALLATVGLSACGDSADIMMGDLSEAEAQDLAGVILSATFNSTGSIPAQPGLSPDGPHAVPFSFAFEFENTVECPLGGVVDVSASLEVSGDTDSEAASIEYSMTQIHNACVVVSENNRTFTL